MKRLFVCLALLHISFFVAAQTAADSVRAVINDMFSAMKTNDGKKLAACFSDSAILQTVQVKKTGEVKILNEAVANFVKSIESAPAGSLDEQIRFDEVKTDGPLAIAWTPYAFYYQGKFSHCGVNSFQLVRINGAWKIQYLIDTRKKECGGVEKF